MRATLSELAVKGMTAERIAERAVVTWRRVEDTLAPVIGTRGVAVVYHRSLDLAVAEYPWLAGAQESVLGPADFAALRRALARQTAVNAAAGNEALLQTFYTLLAGLIGRPLTQRLLPAATEGPRRRRPRKPSINEIQEANEHLLLAGLQAQTIAEAALRNMQELARTSQRDPLTDTPNRALLLDRLETAMAIARRYGTRLGLLFVDIDNFKDINDSLGHGVGDEVMQVVARRLESVVRESDTVSRYGGDEFLVLLTKVTAAADAALIAGKMLAALGQPTHVRDRKLQLAASVGISIFPDDGEDAAALIYHADSAMYRAKRLGGGVGPHP